LRIPAFLVLFLWFCAGAIAQTEPGYRKTGRASFYAKKFHGRRTTNGERYHNEKLTAAHRTLPFGTLVRVTNVRNGRSVVVRVNDRGPFVKDRLIDVSQAAAHELGMVAAGTAPVKVEVVGSSSVSPEPETETVAQTSAPIEPRPMRVINTAYHPAPKALPEPAIKPHYEPGRVYTTKGTVAQVSGYGVQLGAFQQIENALSLCRQLAEKQVHKVFIRVDKRTKTFGVVAGSFNRRKDAEAYVASLKDQGLEEGMVRKFED
jgi:rare lipoprotein A